jgi:hypothetical protein
MNRNCLKSITATLLATCVSSVLVNTAAASDDKYVIRSESIPGVTVIGGNNRFQKPIWWLGDELKGAFFNFVWAYNPNGDTPLPITEDMPGDTILATGVDPRSQSVHLVPDFVDPSLINVPLHQVPISVTQQGRGGFGTGYREQLPTTLEHRGGDAATRAVPDGPITLDSWMAAKGRMKVKCFSDGTAKFEIEMSKLNKNGVYTIWTIYKSDFDNDGAIDGVSFYPLGGIPNVVAADEEGNARISRTLGYCPYEEEKLLFVDVAWNSDGNAYGAAANEAFDPVLSQPVGVFVHTQVMFPFQVTPYPG